ncbi:MAG: MFS transporter [Chloroflexi bacterium]|nr:MFS transporter [Chloroflexota bacterium]
MTTPFLRRNTLRVLPHADIPNIRVNYLMTAAESAVFIGGNWIFFWQLFMTFGQLGLNDALGFAFGLFMEIPTGALADIIGKRWTLRAAMLINGIGFLVMGSATAASGLIVGFLMFQVGIALYSGAAEALTYDSLKERKLEHDYDRVAAASSSVSLVTLMACILIGAWMYQVDVRLPHWAWGVAFLLGFVAALGLTEPKVGEPARFTVRGYFAQLATGARELVKPHLRMFVPLMFGLTGVFFIYSWGIVQPAVAISFGFGPDEQAFISSGAYVVIAVIIRFLPFLRRRLGDVAGLTLVNLGLFGALLLMTAPLGAWGVLPLLLMHMAGSTSRTWLSVVINQRTPSAIRATTLSTVALLTKIPYTLMAVVAGLMIEGGQLSVFLIGMAVSSVALLGLSHVIRLRTSPAARAAPVFAATPEPEPVVEPAG